MKEQMTIGEIAEAAGLNLQTLRYYESLGLLPEPPRNEIGHRQYNKNYLNLIKFIKNLQELNFSLEEIKEFTKLKNNPQAIGMNVKTIIKNKIKEIDERTKELEELKKQLIELDESCSGEMKTCHCPILNSLEKAK